MNLIIVLFKISAQITLCWLLVLLTKVQEQASTTVRFRTLSAVIDQVPTTGGYGVLPLFPIAAESTNAIIKNNDISYCSTAGIGNFSSDTNQLIYGNKVAFSGPTGIDDGYVNLNPNVSVTTWNHLTSPPPTIGQLDNLDIKKQ